MRNRCRNGIWLSEIVQFRPLYTTLFAGTAQISLARGQPMQFLKSRDIERQHESINGR
jgi:hypothetical protein